jgi:hypothetical protein
MANDKNVKLMPLFAGIVCALRTRGSGRGTVIGSTAKVAFPPHPLPQPTCFNVRGTHTRRQLFQPSFHAIFHKIIASFFAKLTFFPTASFPLSFATIVYHFFLNSFKSRKWRFLLLRFVAPIFAPPNQCAPNNKTCRLPIVR